MIKKTFLLLLIASSICSCKKEESEPDNTTNNNIVTEEYFIEGKVNGELIHADYVCPNTGCDENTVNYSEFLNWLTMQRTISSTNEQGWDILIDYVDLDNWNVPDTIYEDDGNYNNEQLIFSYYSGDWVSKNNFLTDHTVLGDNSFKMIVTSKSNDIIEGTFEGMLRNGSNSDSTVEITEGKFKVKIIRI